MPFIPSYTDGLVSGTVLVDANMETIDLPDILEQQVNLLENIENELEAVNLTLDDVDTNLVGIRQTVEAIEEEVGDANINLVNIEGEIIQSNQKLDNIIEEAELLKRQEIDTSTDYDFDIFSEVIVPRLPAPPANEYVKDPFGRNAWYLQNTNAGSTQLYWYATDSPFGYKSNSVLTLGQVIEGGGFYFALYLDKVDASLSLPIFGVYTTPTGSGDAVPGFYKSRKTYGIATNQKLFSGELIVCYNSVTILDKIKNVLPTARRVLLTETSSVGTVGNDETIRYLTLNNDSLTPVNDTRWAISGAGWYNGVDVIRHFRFTTINSIIQEETVEIKQELQAINQKIDSTNDRLYNSTKLIPDWFDLNRLISITGISTPTDVGSMVGGWAGNHIAFNNIPLFSQDNFEVISNNANDTSGGTGCRGVFVYGLNSDLEPITETVVLNGTSAVALTKQFNHINLLTPTAFGSGGTVAGEVVIRRVSPVVQYGSLGSNQHSTGWFKCPAGFKAILKGVNYTSNSSSSIMTLVLVRQLATTSYTIIGRYDCGQSLEIAYPVWTLNPGESLYMYQANAHTSKGVITFELVPI